MTNNVFYIVHKNEVPTKVKSFPVYYPITDEDAALLCESLPGDVEFAGVYSAGADSCQARDDLQNYIDQHHEEESWLAHWGA